MKKKPTEYDLNIIAALSKIQTPILGVDGRKFYFREMIRKETGFEHIANKKHRLKIRDVESIPEILKHPKAWHSDPDNPIFRNYYGIRKGKDSDTFIKIVTSPVKGKRDEEEIIVTIYPTKTIKKQIARKKK